MAVQENNATPPKGYDWGERTRQTKRTHRAPGYWRDDDYEIRQRFGIPEFDPDEFRENPKARMVYPDLIIHERNPTVTTSAKGTDCLVRGKRGCGKSTLAANLSVRLMELNDERIVWRGSPMRSEWLRFRKWATLFLPANASVDSMWVDETDDATLRDVEDLEDVVRDVIYYEDVDDLLDKLYDGPSASFNVVYPDPSFSGCRQLTKETERVSDPLPFTPSWNASEENPTTPLVHWWFAFFLARVERPGSWMSIIFDEVGDLVPERAKQDAHQTYEKIGLLRSVMADSRRARLSVFMFCHYEQNVHHDIRREIKWRIHMPDGSPNPRERRASSVPVGFETVPMYHDVMSDKDVGVGLCYTESEFTWFSWSDIPGEPEDEDRWLRIRLDEPEREQREFSEIDRENDADEGDSTDVEAEKKAARPVSPGGAR